MALALPPLSVMIQAGAMPLVSVVDRPLENTSTPFALPTPRLLPVAGLMNTVAFGGAPALVSPLRLMPPAKVTVVPLPPVVPAPALTAMVVVAPAARLPNVTAPMAPVPLEFEFSIVRVRCTSVSVPAHDVV